MRRFARDMAALTVLAVVFSGVYAAGQLIIYGRVIW